MCDELCVWMSFIKIELCVWMSFIKILNRYSKCLLLIKLIRVFAIAVIMVYFIHYC
jgi:hypothetical protein